MPTYIVFGSYTDQGVRAVKDTVKRAEAARETARKLGATMKEIYWTLGEYDIAIVLDAPDNAAATAFGVSIGALGNVRTHTLPAFNSEEMGKILGRMA
jgi:uncharacterized protein with GYD domain